jgi:hypothetical protein
VTIRGLSRAFDVFGAAGLIGDGGATSEPRPDVQSAYPSAPLETGFKIDLPGFIQTAHSPTIIYYCAYAERPGAEQFLGCISQQPL